MQSVFDMTQEELDRRLRPVVEELVKEAFDKDLYIIYQDENCVAAADFIHEYKDGRKNLVRLDTATLTYCFIRAID